MNALLKRLQLGKALHQIWECSQEKNHFPSPAGSGDNGLVREALRRGPVLTFPFGRGPATPSLPEPHPHSALRPLIILP